MSSESGSLLTGMPDIPGQPGRSGKKSRAGWIAWLAGSLLVLALLGAAGILVARSLSAPRQAPEAQKVLEAQTSLPFQVLIPAYLPAGFIRKRMEIKADLAGPQGEPVVQLIYPARQGQSLTLTEWVPAAEGPAPVASKVRRCLCACRAGQQCNMLGMEFNVGPLRVRVEFSAPNMLSYDQLQFVLETLGPAVNLQVFSSMEDVPVSYLAPPAVDVAVNADGIQELTLVVSPGGYSPVHFAVKKDVPVRLIFRQLGEVGCGNELIFELGPGKNATLILASPNDKQVLEFVPGQAGEFPFNCPHQIFRGVMTVKD